MEKEHTSAELARLPRLSCGRELRIMTKKLLRKESHKRIRQSLVVILCVLSLAPGDTAIYAQPKAPQNAVTDQAAPPIPNDQLNSLVAPIALYPDPLLSQLLVASTYPLEIIQLQQWLQKNKDLKGDVLVSAVEKQDWDPSVQAMAVLPDVVKRLTEDIKWTTDLGNAFLAQQSDVMDAVQRMRAKASAAGYLKSNTEMKVETRVVETKTVVIIQQANPQVVYVPSYNPVVIYGPPMYLYPYPPIFYPPPGYYAAGVFIGFGVGIAVGSYYRGGWGYSCGWGRHTTININVNNRYISHYNQRNINVNRTNVNNVNVNRNRNNNWQHNPQHRGAVPYSNQQVAKQYGGTARGDSASTRQANVRQQANTSNRTAATGNRPPTNTGDKSSTLNNSAANRTGSNAGTRPNSTGISATNWGGSNGGASANNTGANRSSSATGNTIGNRQIPSSDSSKNNNAFGGASSKTSAQASSARGASSVGSSRAPVPRSSKASPTRKSTP